MSQVTKKKLKQATLSYFTSSPKKRKREDDTNEGEETKSRKICDETSPTRGLTKTSRNCIPDEASLRHDVSESNGEHSSSSKSEAVNSEMDVEIPVEQSHVDDVPDESICDKVEMHVPASSDDFSIVDTSPLDTTPQSQVESELSPSKNSLTSHTKKLTPKQLQKKQEAEAKKLEREKLKQEKEKERLEKKEAKEKKRLAEIEAKNEEKRQKEEKRKMKEEELRRQKEAEKKAKEEEKQKKIEEIRMKEEQEKKKQEKTKASFKNFFLPSKSKTNIQKKPENSNDPVNLLFMPFEIKENMKLAPLTRATLSCERKERLESHLREDKSSDECDLYTAQIKSKDYKPGHSENTWPLNLNDDDELKDDNLLRTRYRCKLLQFSENRRPAYWGTWRRRSRTVSGKTPFKCDPVLEYDVDSDEEWVEEPGESLHGSDDEKESDHEYEVDNDLFVPHGYLSDDEGNDENQPKKLDLLKTEFEAELKEKTFKLKSRSYGCTWIANDVHEGANDVEELLLFFRGVYNINLTPFCWKSERENVANGSSATSLQSTKMIKHTTFPEKFLPDFIRLAHGNKISAKNLGVEFCAFIFSKEPSVDLSQVCVKRKLKEIGHWDVAKQLWYVRDEVRKQCDMEELSHTENKWDYVTSVTSAQPKKNTKSLNAVEKSPTTTTTTTTTTTLPPAAPITPRHVSSITPFVKVLTPEERENQLRINAAEKRGESPKKVASPKTTMVNYLVRPKDSSVVKQPIKKRAPLFSLEKDGNWVPTANTTSVTSAAVDSSIVSITTVPSSKNQVTPVNPVMKAIRDSNTGVDDKTSRSETSPAAGETVKKETPIKIKTNEPCQSTIPTGSVESEGDKRKISNVTVKEGKKYATLIPVKRMKGENTSS